MGNRNSDKGLARKVSKFIRFSEFVPGEIRSKVRNLEDAGFRVFYENDHPNLPIIKTPSGMTIDFNDGTNESSIISSVPLDELLLLGRYSGLIESPHYRRQMRELSDQKHTEMEIEKYGVSVYDIGRALGSEEIFNRYAHEDHKPIPNNLKRIELIHDALLLEDSGFALSVGLNGILNDTVVTPERRVLSASEINKRRISTDTDLPFSEKLDRLTRTLADADDYLDIYRELDQQF